MDTTARVVGLVVEQLRVLFTPEQERPPLGGGTELVQVVAGEAAPPPVWMGGQDCSDCGGPYLWVRLTRRFRSEVFPEEARRGSCRSRRAFALEVGVARCAPMELEPCPSDLEQQALVQWDDSWRLDVALCRALSAAEELGAATDSVLGVGEPWGPEGLVIAWLQTAVVQL